MRDLRSHGVTLIELMVVIAILGVVALVAIPTLFSGDVKRLDVATAEVVAALRYARSEALRSGEVHGISINPSNQRVVVYRSDLSTDPVSIDKVIRHPVDHKPYDFDFDTTVMLSGVSISNDQAVFLYPDGRRNDVLFDANGTPVWVDAGSGTAIPLFEGVIRLGYDGQQRSVQLAPVTGRVSFK